MNHRLGVFSFVPVLALASACAVTTDSEENFGSQSSALASCGSQLLTISAATASSEQNNGFFAAAKAIDSLSNTRWSSQPGLSAPQWLRLDFGQRRLISSLNINWETAFAPSYEIQASDNAVNWAIVRKVTNTQSGPQTVAGLDVTARYLRIVAKTLSGYGSVSIIDVTATGDNDPACGGVASTCGQATRLAPAQVQATSQEFSYTPGSAALDGIYSTRWSSAFSDDQALAVDLGSVARIDAVRTTWETAYAAKYAIETAPSMTGPWTEVARNNAGQGGVETLALPAGTTARYLRLHGIQRATGYGYSLWEMDVLGSRDICGPNLLTQGWDPAATTNNFGAPPDVTVPGAYSIDQTVLNRIDFTQSGMYCPVGGSGWIMFTQHVTVPTAGSRFHLVLDIPRNEGTAQFVVASATLNGVQGSHWLPVPTTAFPDIPAGSLTGVGQLQADFDVSLAAGQNVDLQVRFVVIGAGIPNTGCGIRLQSYTLGGATLTRTN